MEKVRLIETGDGSHSLYVREMNETYHSTHGAVTESKHVFLNAGVDYFLSRESAQSIRILEIGFGTGLNALMMLDHAKRHPEIHIDYHTLEPYPLKEEVFVHLNYASSFEGVKQEDLLGLHRSADGEELKIDNFHFRKRHLGVQAFQAATDYQVIFFDAFAPNKQPDMWKMPVLEKMYSILSPSGVLVTYCAQGQFKRDMKEVGFQIETIDGPPGKKEMVRGLKGQ